ncbi:hypothetical protein OIDMADRAFT_29015 [Oidiodendron maius Zn]|uniref:Uncharacterized protein n=1 Tax=Oidiodendron maius (strain Zn) TaxID=913774 RepID=A0A0C3GZC4_OIDMZ|nr:hypothetical protein OIDMADRAFT_29015 [Oidiodendron maius Zn]
MASVQPKPNGPLTRISGAPVLVTQRLVKWRVVTTRGGKHFLFFLELEEHLPGSEVRRGIIELCRAETTMPASIDWHCLRGPVAEAAILDVEHDAELNGPGPHRVVLNGQKLHAGLTEGCRDPSAFQTSTNFTALHARFVVGALPSAEVGPKAILIVYRLTCFGMALVVIAVLLLVSLPGLLVGILTTRADLGISVSGAVAAALVVVKFGIWLAKK